MNNQDNEQKHRYLSMGVTIGTGFGVALGLVFMSIFDNPGFFAIGISVGVSIGVAVGVALDERQ